jgi:hypothetical protein
LVFCRRNSQNSEFVESPERWLGLFEQLRGVFKWIASR